MDYREYAPPADLRHLIKVGWTLTVPGDGPEWLRHHATPDGCLEIIRRLAGRSAWGSEQPEIFVAGALTCPAELQLGRGSRFVGLRLWPWAWRAMTGHSPAELVDRWASLEDADIPMPVTIEKSFDLVRARAEAAPPRKVVEAVVASRSCRELANRTGLSPRGVQRWFEWHVGQPPRTWLRLLRFSDALAQLADSTGSLAEHAVDHGFADQAHMAREFRALAGIPAGRAKGTSQAPFISGEADGG